jgi:hypothetical protein
MFSVMHAGAQECIVNDPTGTPLNVQAHPNGAIVGALYNGVTVYVRDMKIDNAGRGWRTSYRSSGEGPDGCFREY